MNGIQFGKISWQFLFPSGAIILSLAERLLKVNHIWKPHLVINQILIYFIMTLIGVIELLWIKKAKKAHALISLENNVLYSNYIQKLIFIKHETKNTNWVSIIILITISIFYVINHFLLSIYFDYLYLSDQSKIGLIFFQTIISGILSNWIFEYGYSLNHYFALCLLAVGYTYIIGISYLYVFTQWIFVIVAFILYQAQISIEICEKYLMNQNFFTPMRLILIKGSTALVTLIIIMGITLSIGCQNHLEDYYDCKREGNIQSLNIFENHILDVILIIGIIIVSAFYHIFIIYTNYYYSIPNRTIVDIISFFPYWIVNTIIRKEVNDVFWISFVGYLAMLVASCIYTEVIIFNFCMIKPKKILELKPGSS